MEKIRYVLYDLETKDFADFSQGRGKIPLLEVSVLAFYDSSGSGIEVVNRDGLSLFFDAVRKCDIVVGFNQLSFDNLVLEKYDDQSLLKKRPQWDILDEIYKTLGRRISLKSLAETNLNVNKAKGKNAPGLYDSGQIGKLVHYCAEDVRITRLLFKKGLRDGFLQYQSKVNRGIFTVDTSYWESEIQRLAR